MPGGAPFGVDVTACRPRVGPHYVTPRSLRRLRFAPPSSLTGMFAKGRRSTDINSIDLEDTSAPDLLCA